MNSPTTILPKKDIVKVPELTEGEKRSIVKEIETLVRNFLSNITYESELAIRANVEGYVMAGDGKFMFTDFPSVKEYFRKAFENIQSFREAYVPALQVYVLSKG